MKLRNLLGLAELFQPELNIFECDYTLQGETELYFVNLERVIEVPNCSIEFAGGEVITLVLVKDLSC